VEWAILGIVFGILFLGELGDKTQLIVFNLALEHDRPYKVGIGATLGFAVIVTIGVFLGLVITTLVPLFIIIIISGVIFILIGILGARHLKELYRERKNSNINNESVNSENPIMEKENIELPSKLSKLSNNPYLAGFGSIFLMELGDKTQILTITLASIYPYPIEVWLGSFLALIALAWIGVFFGSTIAQKIPKFHIKLISVVVFIFIGVLILITSI
jgi:putative Ca2+/H+ antiporter (TMEM165/GDT1 family)